MHSRRADWQAASSILPELLFGNFLLILAWFSSSSRSRAFADHRSNNQKSKFLGYRRCRPRSVPSRNSNAVKYAPMRIGANSEGCRERQKDQLVMGLAQPLLTTW
jgi:hypothetical protein